MYVYLGSVVAHKWDHSLAYFVHFGVFQIIPFYTIKFKCCLYHFLLLLLLIVGLSF